MESREEEMTEQFESILPDPYEIVEYDMPTCIKCGHKKCHYCSDWCDVINDGKLCCDGECTYK